MYRFELQPPGILYVETSGFWAEAEADAYLAELNERLAALRRAQGFALAMVDGRDAAVQSVPVMAKVADIQSILVAGPRDRAAYIVANSLPTLQARRLSTTEQLQVFDAPSAARTWLLAHHPEGDRSG